MDEPRLCEYMKHRRVGGFGWLAQYEAVVMERFESANYAYLSGWYSGMLGELIEELGEKELEFIYDRLKRRNEPQEESK